MHTPGPDSPYTCTRGDWCSESFLTKHELSVHVLGCFYPCPEPGCSETGLKWGREISRHINMHQSEKKRSALFSQLMTQDVTWEQSLFASRWFVVKSENEILLVQNHSVNINVQLGQYRLQYNARIIKISQWTLNKHIWANPGFRIIHRVVDNIDHWSTFFA